MREQHLYPVDIENSSAQSCPATTQGLKAYLLLARPHQYIKNLFIFAPLFFAGKINDIGLLINTFIAFFAFSFCAVLTR